MSGDDVAEGANSSAMNLITAGISDMAVPLKNVKTRSNIMYCGLNA